MQSAAKSTTQSIRAIYRACKLDAAVPPYDNVTLKIFYEGQIDDSDETRNAGLVPPVPRSEPCPVVLFLPGINVGPESYAWLAERCAAAGMIAVTYSHIAEEMPGYISLTPGLDISALTPGEYGTRPSATALAAILATLAELNADGLLQGMMALEQVVLAGHSAGGSVALFNANRDWFPQVCGAAAYGAHAAASKVLGYDDDAVLMLPDSVPLLMMAGARDGVIASSAHRYGDDEADPLARIRDSFERGIVSDRGDCFLVEIDGANHFSFAYPLSETTGRSYLDWPEEADNNEIRQCIADTLIEFISAATNSAPDNMDQVAEHTLVTAMRRR